MVLAMLLCLTGCKKQRLSEMGDRKLTEALERLGVFVPGLGSASEIGLKEMRSIVEDLEEDPNRVWEYETIAEQYCYEQLRRAVKLYYADNALEGSGAE